jgi:uncharacterized protein with HEPN domain
VNKDIEFLHQILEEIDFILKNTKEIELENLKADPILQRAIIRSLEIIGEASKNISHDLKKSHPKVPWKNAAGLRDRLIHYYFGVDWDIVWDLI